MLSRHVPVLLWLFAVGGIGFAAGFIGPLIFSPEANQGPLFGIFISGPGGALLGIVLCLASRILPVPPLAQWRILSVACIGVALVTLYYVMPEPALRGYVVDAEIQGCQAPAQVVDAAIEYWEKRTAAVTWAAPRPGWQDSARAVLQNYPGLVIDVVTVRKDRIAEERKPWNSGRIVALGWRSSGEKQSYYVQSSVQSCADYTTGSRSLYFTPYDVSNLSKQTSPDDWPPRDPVELLSRALLEPIPDEYRTLIGVTKR